MYNPQKSSQSNLIYIHLHCKAFCVCALSFAIGCCLIGLVVNALTSCILKDVTFVQCHGLKSLIYVDLWFLNMNMMYLYWIKYVYIHYSVSHVDSLQNITAFTKNKRVTGNNKVFEIPQNQFRSQFSAWVHRSIAWDFSMRWLQSKDLDGALSISHVFMGHFPFPQSLSSYSNIFIIAAGLHFPSCQTQTLYCF